MNMFYLILPPIIVVLSLVGIIIFLVKKSSQIKKVYQDEAIELAKKEIAGRNAEEVNGEKSQGFWKKFERILLIILEKNNQKAQSIIFEIGSMV